MAGGWKQHPAVAVPLAVQQRYKQDAADQLAAAIGFFAFLSLVPLLLLAVAAAGFILDDPEDQVAVALALTEAIPGFEATLETGEPDEGVSALIATVVEQRGTVGLIGAVTLLLAGLRVIASAMAATRVVFRGGVVKGVGGWIRKLLSLVVLGLTALLAIGASAVAGIDLDILPRWVSVALSMTVSFGLDLVLFLVAYRVLSTTTSMRWRQLLPGALLAAAGWTLLKLFGSTWVAGQVAGANALYGTLGGVIALLLLLYLAGRLYLYGAELSAVLVERREGPLVYADGGDGEADTGGDRDGGDGQPTGDVEEDAAGPPPVPARARVRPVADPGAGRPSTTSSASTHERLAVADERHEAFTSDRGRHARTAIGMGLGLAALAAGWRLFGPDRD